MCLVLEGLRKVVGKAFFSWTKWQEESEYFRKKIDCKYLKYYTGSEYLVSHGDLKKICGYLKVSIWVQITSF